MKDGTFGFLSLYFDKEIDAGDSFQVEVELKAVEAGIWSGDIDACTPAENFVTVTQTIAVKE